MPRRPQARPIRSALIRAAPLDVVIFKGGFGDDYAINVNENLYNKLYPSAQITYAGIQGLGAQLQPRFVDGSPPDVIDNSGAGNLDTAALVAEDQLADLADLMAAPSYDTEGKTFADTLVPGSQVDGVFDGKQLLPELGPHRHRRLVQQHLDAVQGLYLPEDLD